MKTATGILFSMLLASGFGLGFGLASGCAASTATPGQLSLRDDIPRVKAPRARALVQAGQALLVCAYEDEGRCADVGPKSSITLKKLRARQTGLSKGRTLIFFCNCVGDATAAHVARAYRNRGFTDSRVLKGGTTAWEGRSEAGGLGI